MKMAGDCDAFEDEFAYIFELTDNRSRKPSLLRGFLPIILAFPNLMPSVEAVSVLLDVIYQVFVLSGMIKNVRQLTEGCFIIIFSPKSDENQSHSECSTNPCIKIATSKNCTVKIEHQWENFIKKFPARIKQPLAFSLRVAAKEGLPSTSMEYLSEIKKNSYLKRLARRTPSKESAGLGRYGEKTGNRTMDPEFVAVIFVEKTRKLHLKSLNEIKVSCSKTLETWKEEKIISFEREFVVAFSFSPKPAFKVGWPSWKITTIKSLPEIRSHSVDFTQVQKKSLSSGTKTFPTSMSTFFFPSFMSCNLMVGAASSPKLFPPLGRSTVKCREHPGLISSRSCAAAN
ncbi:hypothetical protein P5673_007758 [Acropora cervicornis]|uniref:Uncharacterized protein n=1 Tax=Acropora cervicornis TaxID=6130 RepID=A0AAD9QUZ5_ACRCE|nr:hypothetical protein P5673_007758 [Acropora cervicornis]